MHGNKLNATAVSEREVNPIYEERNFSRQPQRNNTVIIGDGLLIRIEKDSFRKKFMEEKVCFKCLVEQMTNSSLCDTDHYVIPILIDEKPQTIVIHIGSNDIIKFNYHDVVVSDLADRILQIGLKCRYYSVDSIAFSSVFARNNNNLNKLIRE